MQFDKECGGFRLRCSDPSPSWAEIWFNDERLPGLVKVEELHDLRYLIDRALSTVKPA